MNDLEINVDEQAHPLDALLKGEGVQPPRVGEIVEGPLVARGNAAVFVDLGSNGIGIIFGREFLLSQDILKRHKIGDVISAKVVDPENHDGYTELSMSAAGREIAWEALQKAYEGKETIEVTIEGANRGGLMATVSNIKAFLPVSQLAPEHYPHIEGGDKERILSALREFVGKKFRAKVIGLDVKSEKLILSERAVMEEELRGELKNFHVGDTVQGAVSGIVDFGLFLRFGPDGKLEGLAHISELSWGIVENIRDLYQVGQQVKAKIIDLQGERVSLSLKALLPDPWENIEERLKVEGEVSGRVVKIIPSGAIIEVEPNIQGIVRNLSEGQGIAAGQTGTFRIVSLSPKEHRMELSWIDETGETASAKIVETETEEKKEAEV